MIKQTSGEIAPLNLIFFVVVIVLVALQLFVFVQNRIEIHIEQTVVKESMKMIGKKIIFICLMSLVNGHLTPKFNKQPDGSISAVIPGKGLM